MTNRLNSSIERFNNLPVRTRLILTFASIAMTFLAFQVMWFNRVDANNKKLATELQNIDQQIALFTQAQQEINSGVYLQRHDPKQQQLLELQKQVNQIEFELEQKTKALVRPESMAQLLKEILDNSKKLKLLSLNKETPVPLFDKEQANQVQMFRHPMVLVFEGSYDDTQKFLLELESMQRKVNFEHFEFSVEHYPKSKITLVVSTYSTSRKWIGG